MTFKIADGREHFYQWDLNRQVIVDDPTITEVHFCNRLDDCSLVVEVVDGKANVPNILLQNGFSVRVFAYDGEATRYDAVFEVKARTRPSDYVYTETEVLSVQRLEEELRKDIDERLAGLEQEVENDLLLGGFATKEYVEEAINNIEIPEDTEVIEVNIIGSNNYTTLDKELATKITANPDKCIIKASWTSGDIKGVYYTFSRLERFDSLDLGGGLSYPATANIHYSALTETGYSTDPQITASTLRFYIKYESDNTTVDSGDVFITTKTINSSSGGDVDLSNYYTKTEVDGMIPDTSSFITEVPAEYITETELNNKGYLTEHQSLEEYAKKSELFSKDYNDLNNKPTIPSIEGLATEQYVDEAIANIDIPESGGSAEGAVSYLEAQELTTEQLATARKNLDLPYTSTEDNYVCQNKSQSTTAAASTVYLTHGNSTLVTELQATPEGTKFTMTVTSPDGSFTETVACENWQNGWYRVLSNAGEGDLAFFTIGNSQYSASNIQVKKQDTSAIVSSTANWIYTVIYAKPKHNSLIPTYYLDADIFTRGKIEFSNDSRGTTPLVQLQEPTQDSHKVPNYSFVYGASNAVNSAAATNQTPVVVFGYNNTVPSSTTTASLIVGKGNRATNDAHNARTTKLYILGEGLLSTQNYEKNSLIIGKYNEKTSKYIPYSYLNTYNTGDCVTPNSSSYNTAVYRSLIDNNKANRVPSGTTSDDYWEYVDNGDSSTYLFTIGNGTNSEARSNAFTVDALGNVVSAGTMTPTGADYAEYFEFEDGNPNREDRIGYLVELSGAKIKLANGTDILGAVSNTMGVIGDAEEMNWHGKYERDEFGRPVFETVEVEREITNEETGETEKITEFVTTKKLSKDYDPNRHYAPRSDRPEWAPIGLLGKVLVRHDGTLSAGDYVKAINGIASKSDEKTNVRVLEVVSENVIRVLIK